MNIKSKCKKLFKEHKATMKDLGEVKLLEWKRDNSSLYSIQYIFCKDKLYVSGDLGHAIYWTSFKDSLDEFKGMSLGYFYGKLIAQEGSKYAFNRELAKEEILENTAFMFQEYNEFKADCEDRIKELKEEAKECTDEDMLEDIKYQIEMLESDIRDAYESEGIKKKEDVLKELLDNAFYTRTTEEWENEVDRSLSKLLCEYDEEYWEWLYDVGADIPERNQMHLIGLKMANKYLNKNK